MKSWSNNIIVEGKHQIDSFNYSLHYATSVWEGIRAYKQENGQTAIWKLEEHVQRLFDSAKIIGIKVPFTQGQIIQGCKDIVEANGNGDLYLRPIVFNEVDAEGILSSQDKISVDIYCKAVTPLHDKKDEGIKMLISSFVRGYPQFQMQCKTAANYTVIQQVKYLLKNDIKDVFLLDNNGHVVEATVANFFVVKGDVIMTPPNDGSILAGITRRCVAEILQDKPLMFVKYKKSPILVEKKITKADIYTADEIILCGTYAELVNVVEVDNRIIGSGERQFYFKMLLAEYTKRIRGQRA